MSIPPMFNFEEPLKFLYDRLDPSSAYYERLEQHKNLRAVVKLYESG